MSTRAAKQAARIKPLEDRDAQNTKQMEALQKQVNGLRSVDDKHTKESDDTQASQIEALEKSDSQKAAQIEAMQKQIGDMEEQNKIRDQLIEHFLSWKEGFIQEEEMRYSRKQRAHTEAGDLKANLRGRKSIP